MYVLQLKLSNARANFRMLRALLGDWLCFSLHTHKAYSPDERVCETCWRWWENDYCTSRYVQRRWREI